MLSHDQIWEALDRLAERHELTPSGLARRAGLDPTSFNKSKRLSADGRLRWPSTESIAKVLDATGASMEQFMAFMRPDAGPSEQLVEQPVKQPAAQRAKQQESAFPQQGGSIPLLGFAQAGAGGFFDDGGFPAGQGWDVVEFPATPARKAGVYALEVQGESMMPLYRDGDVLIVEPGAQVRRNDRVVVRTNEGEVMAKVLLRQSPRSIELMSLNPEHPNRTLELSDVDWIARIIWASQ
ncbi:helix-turn-helix transcriptional regulator [Rhizobium leguminosarum]|uniref:S24 family peptidase n=1 Tax=Rhizobium leguminosarum TaxID=384 RepID=UPI001C93BCEF|nr:helix-turn-helix transcriptional regulator [Rhizobium leguminosarum]MBY5808320.1 helix-turn-helix transcriptional regulator [Rhizobium leguminosarum]